MCAASQSVIHKQWQTQPARDKQAIRGGKTCVTFDQLKLAIPLIHLELDVRDTTQPDLPEECQRQFLNIRYVVSYMVSRSTHIYGVSSDKPLGEIDEIISTLIQVGVIAA